jgi:predicted dithiol-disulfide oxidoreductase (DUF899 family)
VVLARTHQRRDACQGVGDASVELVAHFGLQTTASERAGQQPSRWWADNFERNVLHLAHRDVTLVAISRAPLEKLMAYAKRFGWTFPWYSSARTDFNFDYHVSFDPSRGGEQTYNFQPKTNAMTELPGISVFHRDEDGDVFHTYSAYSRGLDMMNAGYHYLDLVPKGRDEAKSGNMGWLRRRDEYDAPA